jgi:hypothetical protein
VLSNVQSTTTRLTNAIATGALGLGAALFAAHNLGNRYFWSDEASSFLTALGFPTIGQRSTGLAEAWATNSSGLEPGMFNWIERFWALGIGTDIVTLRALPFVFFLAYIGSLLILSRLVKAPWILGCAVVGLMLLENITPYYAVELRPSIAGLAAAVALPLIGISLIQATSLARGLLIFVPIFIVLASMQYNSLPIIVGLSAILIVASFKNHDRHRRVVYRVVAFFVLMWLPFVYVLLMGNPFDLVGGDSLKNIPEAYIPNMQQSEAMRVIATNFFSFTALPRTLFLLLIPVLWIAKRHPLPTRECEPFQWVINLLWIVVFVATSVTAVLGIFGFIPWILGTRWSISEVGLIGLSLIGLIGLLSHSQAMAKKGAKPIIVALSLVICMAGAFRIGTYERTPGFNWNDSLEIIFEGKRGGTFIDLWTYPELRYWLEYSGQYDQYRDMWIDHGIQAAGSGSKAEAKDIQDFLNSDADRLLLRSESALEGVNLPAGIRVMRVNPWDSDWEQPLDYPALLIKD